MGKQPYVVAFFSLFICSAVILLFTVGGNIAVGNLFSSEQTYEEHTSIASIDVSGMTEEEATLKLNNEIAQWNTQTKLKASLFEERTIIPKEIVHFDIPSALKEAWTKDSVEIHAVIDEQRLKQALAVMEYEVEDLIDYTNLGIQLANDVGSFHATTKTYHLHEFLLPQYELIDGVVTSASVMSATSYLYDWTAALDGYVIEPETLFSLQESLKESGVTILDADALDVLATGLFQLFSGTNFELLERHTNLMLPDYTTVGYAAAASSTSMDLKVLNPNDHSYELRASYHGNQLELSLIGVPFMNHYELLVEQIEEIKPRTIVQFSPKRTIGDRQVMKNGTNGYAAEVYLLTFSSNGDMITKEKIASDYYPADHRVEEWSLQEKKEKEDEYDRYKSDDNPPTLNEPNSNQDNNQNSHEGNQSSTNQPDTNEPNKEPNGDSKPNQGNNSDTKPNQSNQSNQDNNANKPGTDVVKGEE